MSDFLILRDSWRDALLKEYAEQEFEDDGTMLEVNVDTGDDDECCNMIKQKYADILNVQWAHPRKWFTNEQGKRDWVWATEKQGNIPISEFATYGIDCDKIRNALEDNAFNDRGSNPEKKQMRKDHYSKIIKEWDDCEKSTNSWKNELR